MNRDNGLWVFNADGAGLRQITRENIGNAIAVSPSGGKLAYLADTNPDNPALEKISLRLLSLPDGTIQTIGDVMPPLASMLIPTPGAPPAARLLTWDMFRARYILPWGVWTGRRMANAWRLSAVTTDFLPMFMCMT